jgi:hypothetical protein
MTQSTVLALYSCIYTVRASAAAAEDEKKHEKVPPTSTGLYLGCSRANMNTQKDSTKWMVRRDFLLWGSFSLELLPMHVDHIIFRRKKKRKKRER